MKLRGERECKNCGERWSYYETGKTTCPNCGSLRSVGVEDERKRHTDSPAEIDLSGPRAAVGDDAPIADVADEVEETCRRYLRRRGFIHGGELQTLDDTFLTVQELRTAIADYGRDERVGVDHGSAGNDDAERYVLTLLAGADEGDRPPADQVPESMTAARGLAYARAVEAYREDVATYLEDNPNPDARRVLERIRDHEKRHSALDGDVSPAEAEALVRACRALNRALTSDGTTAERALEDARDELNSLAAA